MTTPLPELVDAYLQHHATGDKRLFWAFDEVLNRTLESSEPGELKDLILALIAAASDECLRYVGAGPLEDFVHRFGAQEIAWLEASARRDPRFRSALGNVWVSRGDLPADATERLILASGGRITLLGPSEA